MTIRAIAIPSPSQEAELVAQAAAGDRTAFVTIYNQLADAVYARLTRLLGPAPEREDVMQLVFLQLYRSLPAYRGDASLATFVYRITVHAAYDHLRARKRRLAPVESVALDELVADAPSPEARTQRREELAQLFDQLESLTPDKRIALVLVCVEGLSLREAAELVGATPDAVKQRVLHARRELLARIARENP